MKDECLLAVTKEGICGKIGSAIKICVFSAHFVYNNEQNRQKFTGDLRQKNH